MQTIVFEIQPQRILIFLMIFYFFDIFSDFFVGKLSENFKWMSNIKNREKILATVSFKKNIR
jgi:hypothetical protein